MPRLPDAGDRRFLVGPGDDAAVFIARPGMAAWAITTDMLVEGVHFDLRWTSAEDLGWKALAVNLSDLAAMGDVRPALGVVAAGLPPSLPVGFVDGFYRGLGKLARRYGFSLAGGDTVRSDRLVVSLAVLGELPKGRRPLTRAGARPGDELMVTGTLGDAAAGLEILKAFQVNRGSESRVGRDFKKASLPFVRGGLGRGRDSASSEKALPPPHPLLTKEGGMNFGTVSNSERFLVHRLLRPEPRVELAAKIACVPGVTAMIDSSDGLWRSSLILAGASHVGVRIETERLPLSPALVRWASRGKRDARELALAGGEDYELVLTARPAAARRLASRGWAKALGRVVAGGGVRAVTEGRTRSVPHEFEHFR